MITELFTRNRHSAECAHNYLPAQWDTLISLFGDFERIAGNELKEIITSRDVQKGELLMREGVVPRQLWILESGIARSFWHGDADTVTTQFFFPCEFIDCYHSSFFRSPSAFSIEMIVSGSVIEIRWDKLRELQQKYPALHHIEKCILACRHHSHHQRILTLQQFPAAEHYRQLITRYPQLHQQGFYTYIASYLGITLTSLSRLRRELE